MHRITPVLALRVDAGIHLMLAGVLAVLAPRLAGAAGLAQAWPVWLLAAVFLILAVENALAARRPTGLLVGGVIAGDVLYALAATALVIADPTGAAPWLRGLVLATVPAALLMAALKARQLRRGAEPLARQTAT